jgi:hypothetical protein
MILTVEQLCNFSFFNRIRALIASAASILKLAWQQKLRYSRTYRVSESLSSGIEQNILNKGKDKEGVG